MKPIEFPEQTIVLGANPAEPEIDGLEVGKLPIYSDGHQTISCWGLSFWERLKVLLFGRIWLSVHFGDTQPPVWLSVDRTVFVDSAQDSETVPAEA